MIKVKAELPKGITIRKHEKSEALQIFFMYKNVRCREVLQIPPTPANIKKAFNQRNLILAEIEAKTFEYQKYFPNSPKVEFFSDKPKNHSMKYIFDKQIAEYQAMEERGNLSISTLNGYKRVNNVLIRYLGNINVEDLTPIDIKNFMHKQGLENICAKTMRNRLSLLRMALDEAKNDGLITINPLDGIAVQKQISKTAVNSEYKVEPFNEDEQKKILSVADGQIKNFIQFNFWAGLRISELIALKWTDIDFKRGIIHIQRAKVENKIKTTKTKAGIREIFMLPKAREALMEQMKYTSNDEYVFNNPHTNKEWSHSAKIHGAWQRVIEASGVKYRNPYQMRHTYASTLISRGENIFWLATQMGHENTEMISKHYGKWIPQKEENGYEFVGNY